MVGVALFLWWLTTDPAQILEVEVSSGSPTLSESSVPTVDTFWPVDPNDTEMAVTGLAIGPQNDVYILHRSDRSFSDETALIPDAVIVRVEASTGTVVAEYGHNLFASPHGLSVAVDGSMWVADTALNTVTHLSPDGLVVQRYGDSYPFYLEPLLRLRNLLPQLFVPMTDTTFARPTDVVPLGSGRFAVSDGYRNSRLAVFTADGGLVWQRNVRGSDPGEFHLPHGISTDRDGRIYVADRRNARLQVFSSDGALLDVVTGQGIGRPFGVASHRNGCLYIADGGDGLDHVPTWSPDTSRAGISVIGNDGTLTARVGNANTHAGQFILPHDVAVSGDGIVYIADLQAKRVLRINFPEPC